MRFPLLPPAVLLGTALLLPTSAWAADSEAADRSALGPDFELQGEYVGQVNTDEGMRKFGVQVIALGEGKFEAVGFGGGLPGDGWDGQAHHRITGQRDQSGGVTFSEPHATARLHDGQIELRNPQGAVMGTFKKTERKSPTLGKQPPEGAVVLFDGSSTEHWRRGRMTDDKLLMQGTTSRPEFQSHRLHIEFQLPFEPDQRGQARANSGIYLQGRYEVQMLDSFGLEGKDNECGGIYEISAPKVNMCLPPMAWQTYDIEFHAAQYNDQGEVVRQPRITVQHNGVPVQESVELPRATRAAPVEPGPEPGPVYLQDHGNPVRYRNIWVVPIES
jgi:hypothetical protein